MYVMNFMEVKVCIEENLWIQVAFSQVILKTLWEVDSLPVSDKEMELGRFGWHPITEKGVSVWSTIHVCSEFSHAEDVKVKNTVLEKIPTQIITTSHRTLETFLMFRPVMEVDYLCLQISPLEFLIVLLFSRLSFNIIFISKKKKKTCVYIEYL